MSTFQFSFHVLGNFYPLSFFPKHIPLVIEISADVRAFSLTSFSGDDKKNLMLKSGFRFIVSSQILYA